MRARFLLIVVYLGKSSHLKESLIVCRYGLKDTHICAEIVRNVTHELEFHIGILRTIMLYKPNELLLLLPINVFKN